ncbi:MAG: hypothetical protein IT425_06475 [Pirellulales bacterium]|nr:hypothetical protein [Pirellulales bacterium]
MNWHKLGLVWAPTGELPWAQSHATLPVVQVVGGDRWCVFVGCRDDLGKTRIARLELNIAPLPNELPTVLSVAPSPILPLGLPGTFDDSGMMPGYLVADGDSLLLYYIGWNVKATVPYHTSIGLAISHDRGHTFQRHSLGPILDRSAVDPYFTTSPCVLREEDCWRMWYISGTGWREINGRWEPEYHVKLAESPDGYSWTPTGISCIDPGPGYAIGHPCVFRHDCRYAMLYSIRSTTDYRTDSKNSYHLGYADSTDGIRWNRRDKLAGITCSASGWDSEMIEYAWLQHHNDQTYLLHNGNGFGRSGFGIAHLHAS